MKAFELWAVYVTAVIGSAVEDAEQKFSALADTERAAWEAVAVCKAEK